MRRRRQRPVNGLMVSGLSELALGALTGWPYALAIADPGRAKKVGIRSTARLRQWHLDLIALGGLTTMAGAAFPDVPNRVAWPLGVGAWTNAMAFGVLMVKPEAQTSHVYRTAVAGSFVATSAGFTGLAVEGWRRWLRNR